MICDRVVLSKFWRLCPRVSRETFENNGTPISARFGPGVCGPVRKSLNILHSIECLHNMRMMEGHVCTNRRIQSEIQRFGHHFLLNHDMRSPNSSALSPLTRDLSGLGFVQLQNGHVFTSCW